MKDLKAIVLDAANNALAWAAEIEFSTVLASAGGAVVVWLALKAVGAIIEEYVRRFWFGKPSA